MIEPDLRRRGGHGGELRLLCDEMLKGIGRWLRAAGYDVAIADDGLHDDDLLARARADKRLLLTCDRRLASAPAMIRRSRCWLPRAWMRWRELSAWLGIDWLHAPFTRCLVETTPGS